MGFEPVIYVLLLPLLAFAVNALASKKIPALTGGLISTVAIAISLFLSMGIAYEYFITGKTTGEAFAHQAVYQFTWLKFTESLSVNFGLLIDSISFMMLLVVTLVSFLVHLYSLSYMNGEKRYGIFFSFLSLFSFSMLGLVLSGNILQMYVFWELVGVSSFLLIGFYYDKPSAVAASKKAFIVTRFADLGFLTGILLLSSESGSLDIPTIIERLADPSSGYFLNSGASIFMGASALTWALSLIFIGGAGKSAMFPLHIWLPDAMEGPTPVSALIHAATMVVAGVFLVARLFPVFHAVPATLDLVTYTGLFSALFAAVIACTQTDIKRILAYSTMSQIGFMMFALGISGLGGESGLGYSASLFHLVTHSMFKALLFLAAGVVIHAVHHNELSAMGGLRNKLPLTHILFLIACLAISGIPPLSGFFSKEEILTAAYSNNFYLYLIALLTAGITAFYMFRLYFLIFWNKPPAYDHHDGQHGEAALPMLISLLLLGAGTVFAGFIPFSEYITTDGLPFQPAFHLDHAAYAVTVSAAGILVAMVLYFKSNERPVVLANRMRQFYAYAYHKFYIDEVYLFITRRIIFGFLASTADWIDRNIIDRSIGLSGEVTHFFSGEIKSMQSGKLQDYVAVFIFSALLLSLIIIYY